MTQPLVFIIPVVDKVICKSWRTVNENLQRTLQSILLQRNAEVRAVIVCRDVPDFEIKDSRVSVIQHDFPTDFYQIGSYQSKHLDKGRKLYRGLVASAALDPMYVMPLDQDDIVHRDLAYFCLNNPGPDAWIVDKGFRYDVGSRFIYKKMRNFNQECGSSAVFKPHIVPLPEPLDYTRGFDDFRLLINHPYLRENLENLLNARCQSIPFNAVIYYVHHANELAQNRNIGILNLLKKLVFNRPFSSQIKRAFNFDT